MDEFDKKIYYLKGLLDGLSLGDESGKNIKKVMHSFIDLIEFMHQDIKGLKDKVSALELDMEEEKFVSEFEIRLSNIKQVICPKCGYVFFYNEEDQEEDFLECPGCGEFISL